MSPEVQRRVTILLVLATLGTFGLVAQLGNLQLIQASTYQRRAESQRTRALRVAAPRGNIYDRTMQPLAANRAANVLFVQYPQYKDRALLERLSQVLEVPLPEIDERVQKRLAEEQQWGPRYWEPVRARDAITPRQHARVLEFAEQLPGVILDVQPIRVYPFGQRGAHMLGYVGPISAAELADLKDHGYTGGDVVGKFGLEKYYEQYLRGFEGLREIEIDFGSKPRGPLSLKKEPVPGRNLVLTLDWKLQEVAERALDWNMFQLQNLPHPADLRAYPKAKAGAVVVMDVKTGAIRAMASRPSFDPNLFVTGISSRDYQRYSEDSLSPLWNRAASAEYHPGSTWKMVTGAAALGTGVIGAYDTVFCTGKYELTGQACWQKWGHGAVNIETALRDSCDVYFYDMGRRLNIDRLVQWAHDFGFGHPTGVDLPDEMPGFLPDATYRSAEEAKGNLWTLGSTASAAIGQINEVTPLQLAQYIATLANQGKKMRPYLVDKIVDHQGQVAHQMIPEEMGFLPVRPEDMTHLLRGMELVNLPGGTSDFAFWPLPGIPTGGKTGTAENPPHDDYGIFVGFAPLKNPEIAVAVVIEQAGHGSSISPVARSIFASYFNINLPAADPAYVPQEYPDKATEILRKLRGAIGGPAGN